MTYVINFHTMFTRKLYIIASILSAVMTWQNIVNLWNSSSKRLPSTMPTMQRWMHLADIVGTESIASPELRGAVVEDTYLHTLCCLVIAIEALRAGVSPLSYLMFSYFSNAVFPLFLMNQYEKWMNYNAEQYNPTSPRLTLLRLHYMPLLLFFLLSGSVTMYINLIPRPEWVGLFVVECGLGIYACTMVPMSLGHYSFPLTISGLSASTSRHLKYLFGLATVCGCVLVFFTRREIEFYNSPMKVLADPVKSFIALSESVAIDKRRGGELGSNKIGVAVGVPWISYHVTAALFVIIDRVGLARPGLMVRLLFGILTLVCAPFFLPMYLSYREAFHEILVNAITQGATTPPPVASHVRGPPSRKKR